MTLQCVHCLLCSQSALSSDTNDQTVGKCRTLKTKADVYIDNKCSLHEVEKKKNLNAKFRVVCSCVWLQVNAAFPFGSRGHGVPSLSLLQILSTNIHPNTDILWEKEIPPLISVLEGMLSTVSVML